MKRETKNKRSIQTFEPCGPILQMLNLELIERTRNKPNRRGEKVRMFEDLVANACGHKYPKLLERFKILREESTR